MSLTLPSSALLQSSVPNVPRRQGKVRDVYDLGDRLLIVASDRISAFDYVMPNGIPGKGIVLTQMSNWWFDQIQTNDHLLPVSELESTLKDLTGSTELLSRSVLGIKTEVLPVECIVRGYLSGSGWNEYQKTQSVCGVPLPAGLKESDQLPEPIFTPTSKADEGHDMPMTFEEVVSLLGAELAETLKQRSIAIYSQAAELARTKGVLIADTKFEFGKRGDELILIDEILTPDSSRFWPLAEYEPGRGQTSFDKQFVRDYLLGCDWDRNSPAPALPEDVVAQTQQKYLEAYDLLTK